MVLGSSSLRFVETPAPALAAAVAARLGHPAGPLDELVLLRLQALDVAMSLRSPELLADQRSWEAVRLPTVAPGIEAAGLDDAVLEVLREHLDQDQVDEVERLHLLSADPAAEVGPAVVSDRLPAGARAYLEFALAGRRSEAVAVVTKALSSGLEGPEIMLSILQPAQIELGRLWAADSISVADEHLVTATTQRCLAMLFSVPRQRAPEAPRLVALTVGSETHELGIGMVAEVFQHAGWDTSYLGADIPHRDVAAFVGIRRPDVLAVSATMVGHLHAVRDLIAEVRADPRCSGVSVLVGGRPFALHPALAEFVGADGWATGPREALELCRSWVERRSSV